MSQKVIPLSKIRDLVESIVSDEDLSDQQKHELIFPNISKALPDVAAPLDDDYKSEVGSWYRNFCDYCETKGKYRDQILELEGAEVE